MRNNYIAFIFIFLCGQLFSQSVDLDNFKGITVRNIGPAGMSGRVTAIDVVDSNEDKIYVGTASGGVWLSENGGISWRPIFDKQSTLSIGALKINQTNPSEIWVGTGEGNPRNSANSGAGIFRSLDGGDTWEYMGLKETRAIHRIIIDETKPGTIYIGAQGSQWGNSIHRGVYKTTDSGKNWNKILYQGESSGIADMVADPNNPNKIIAALWDFGRTPWFFNSGGAGSGLHITYDGGKSWKKLSKDDGIPAGDIGRIGLAFSSSNSDIVYALIEAKENALYKSLDGGKSWKKHSTHKNIGNRPFYYSEIYVDPHDHNRVYSLWSYLSRSTDGGKEFEVIADYGNNVHPDHHALWISKNDPSYIIDGNDGGLNISHDGGDTWRFITNLPVGQFYHVNIDHDFPYNVYGGMQDNGTWVGPGFTLKSGGITNGEWQEVYFGDGFDAAPLPHDNRYIYAMSQGGNLGLVDKKTGLTRFVRPNHPDTTYLRYNWNAALALKPNTNCGLYYGSQFVHYSTDCGQSWTIISPDLTTNDTSKHHQDISGGLTIDATNAENHTTILCIEPSAINEDIIWVGTDDGNIQLTLDGGENWKNMSPRIRNMPKKAWIPQIIASTHNEGEAFVVVNNYRMNDFKPYAYHTNDYGKSWTSIVSESQISSFVSSLVQDPYNPNLLFLGTDAGLYVSINQGSSWNKWNDHMPPVQIRDMKIQPSFNDLVLGTFGRAFWIIDDISPLREIANSNYTQQNFSVVSASDGYLSSNRSYQGIRFIGQAEFVGQNKDTDVQMSVWIKPDQKDDKVKKEVNDKAKQKSKKDDKIHIAILNIERDTIRQYSRTPKEKGLVRINWDMQSDGVRMPSRKNTKKSDDLPSGSFVLPGFYKAIVSYKDAKDSINIVVKMDPRIEEISEENIADLRASNDRLNEKIEEATNAFNKLKQGKKNLAVIKNLVQTISVDSTKQDLEKECKKQSEKIDALMSLFMEKENLKGIQRNPKSLNRMINFAKFYQNTSYGKPNENAQIAVDKAVNKIDKVVQQVNEYFNEDWLSFKNRMQDQEFDIYKIDND